VSLFPDGTLSVLETLVATAPVWGLLVLCLWVAFLRRMSR
jgi:hypothetical protein